MPLWQLIGKWLGKCCTFSFDDLSICILWNVPLILEEGFRLVLLYQYEQGKHLVNRYTYHCLKDTPPSLFLMEPGKTEVCRFISPSCTMMEAKETLSYSSSQWTGVLPFSRKHERFSVVLPAQQERKLTLYFLIPIASAWVGKEGSRVTDCQHGRAGIVVYAPWHGLEGIIESPDINAFLDSPLIL